MATTCGSGLSIMALQRLFEFQGFVPAYIRPLFCEGKGLPLGGAFRRPGGYLPHG